MHLNKLSKFVCIFLIALYGCSSNDLKSNSRLTLVDQGSFFVGGNVRQENGVFDPISQGAFNPKGIDSKGQTRHGDHAYVFYQVPEHARKLPLIFWHGFGQTAKTWETTPDGREGFQNIFLKRHFSTYLIDQPHRGKASKSVEATNITSAPDEQLWFGIFRLGIWPNFYKGVQFSKNEEALNQFFRQGVSDSGPSFQTDLYIKATSALFDKLGRGILVTHSASGGLGWRTALKNKNVSAIVSFEPGGDFVFPDDEQIEPVKLGARVINIQKIPKSEFMALTKIPILIYYGDNIPSQPSQYPGEEQWRVFLSLAKKWAEVVNKNGGDVTLVHLPEIGIKGNTHFPFADLNNLEIADHMSKFLAQKKLD